MSTFQGKVISVKSLKTVIVEIIRESRHPLYHKIMTKTKRFPAHVDGLEVKEGDNITIVQTKPISKTKNFRVVSVDNKNK